MCLDAKMNFDDNALYRQPKVVEELRDETEEDDPAEVEAAKSRPQLRQAGRRDRLHGQRRRPRHGHHGHHQAVRLRARQLPGRGRRRHHGTKVTEAFKIIVRPKVKGILVNIFGGIMRCDLIAEGVVIGAVEEVGTGSARGGAPGRHQRPRASRSSPTAGLNIIPADEPEPTLPASRQAVQEAA